MKIIIGKRQSGRTLQAIQIANNTGAYLVVHSHHQACLVRDQTQRFPLSYDELLNGKLRGSYVRNIVIDNLEMFFAHLLPGITIEAVVLQEEEKWPENTPKTFEPVK